MYALHLQLVRKPVVDFLFVIIERLSLSLTVETLQAEICRSRHFWKGVGDFERKFPTEGGVARQQLLVSANYRVIAFRVVSKYPQCVVWFCHKARV